MRHWPFDYTANCYVLLRIHECGEAIRGFMFALIVGVIVGTYSSMFIATPIMFDTLSNKSLEEKKED